MKRTLSTFLLLLVIVTMKAQSAYISASPLPEADRVADLKGAGGVLIISQHSDLAITVINAKEAAISPRGRQRAYQRNASDRRTKGRSETSRHWPR